ncbi:hypothetical protein Agub_g7253, partial [Astrephomene gubernaculifera]
MPAELLPNMDLLYGASGDAMLVPSQGELLPPLVQAPPLNLVGLLPGAAAGYGTNGSAAGVSSGATAAVHTAYLAEDTAAVLAGELLAEAAHPLLTLFPRGPAWPDVSLPSALLEPTPPPPGGPEHQVGWQLLDLNAGTTAAAGGHGGTAAGGPGGTTAHPGGGVGRIDSLALQRRLAARGGGGGGGADWRGLSVSLPYMPGGHVAVQGPSGPAAAEALSGRWLAQLEAGLGEIRAEGDPWVGAAANDPRVGGGEERRRRRPVGRWPRVAAPGLGTGLFGGWAAADEEEEDEEEGLLVGEVAAAAGSGRATASLLPPLTLTTPSGERITPLAEALSAGAAAAAASEAGAEGGFGATATGVGSGTAVLGGGGGGVT